MKSLLGLLLLAVAASAIKDRRYGPPQMRRKPYPSTILALPKDVSCGPGQFRCTGFAQCIPEAWVCDTHRDCVDGTDERNCPTNCTGPHQFHCHNGHCISIEYRCDGINDCNDREYSDEINCYKVQCRQGKVQCDNFLCIEETSLCDNINDCKTGWDETNCTSTCSSSEFHCTLGTHCIDRRSLCDGFVDCPDRSDETSCNCQDDQFKCHNGKCIPETSKCNGFDDCGDFSDEHPCATIQPNLCRDMMAGRDCGLMNDTTDPICLDQENGFKLCRKFCGLCIHT